MNIYSGPKAAAAPLQTAFKAKFKNIKNNIFNISNIKITIVNNILILAKKNSLLL